MINITSWTELDDVRDDLTEDYQLMNDLKASDIDYEGIGDSWVPIGVLSSPMFTGTFNGRGHSIEDLVVRTSSHDGTGLFGAIGSVSKISCLAMIRVDVLSTGRNVGGIVGVSYGTITDSYVTGSIESSTYYVGGIAGQVDGVVINCYNSANITAESHVGGLIGGFGTGRVENSFNVGVVIGVSYQGGGLIGNTTSSVKNCGWFRHATGATYAIIDYAVPSEKLVTFNVKVGGGVGYIDDSVAWFYDKTRLIYGETQQVNRLAGPLPTHYKALWDFTNVWEEHVGGFPTLRT